MMNLAIYPAAAGAFVKLAMPSVTDINHGANIEASSAGSQTDADKGGAYSMQSSLSH